MSNFTIRFTVSLDTSRCDPEALDDLREQVQEDATRLIERHFPSGELGPNQTIAELVGPVEAIGDRCINKLITEQ